MDFHEFDTVEDAIEYLNEHDGREVEELRIGLEANSGPDTRKFEEEEIERHAPDLPVEPGDRTHQALWLIGHYGDGGFLSNFAVAELSEDESFTADRASPATNALLRMGYVERAKDGRRVFHRVTERGKQKLRKLGRQPHEPGTQRPTENALNGEW